MEIISVSFWWSADLQVFKKIKLLPFVYLLILGILVPGPEKYLNTAMRINEQQMAVSLLSKSSPHVRVNNLGLFIYFRAPSMFYFLNITTAGLCLCVETVSTHFKRNKSNFFLSSLNVLRALPFACDRGAAAPRRIWLLNSITVEITAAPPK